VVLQGLIGKNAKIRIFRSVWLHSVSQVHHPVTDVALSPRMTVSPEMVGSGAGAMWMNEPRRAR